MTKLETGIIWGVLLSIPLWLIILATIKFVWVLSRS
jgi:hypothetical protein